MKEKFKTLLKKNYQFMLLGIFILVSCESNKPSPERIEGETSGTSLITLTVKGKSHEFVKYSTGKYNNGISHWPDCKYCKE